MLFRSTGNSCRSIIAEAILKSENIDAFSSGVKASGKVNPNAKKILQEKGIWSDEFHSKTLDKVIDIKFDLVITVCDNAKETCPIFPNKTKTIHIPFSDPDGKEYKEFIKTYEDIKNILLPKVKELLITT